MYGISQPHQMATFSCFCTFCTRNPSGCMGAGNQSAHVIFSPATVALCTGSFQSLSLHPTSVGEWCCGAGPQGSRETWEDRGGEKERTKGILRINRNQTMKPEESSLYWKVKRLTPGLLKAFLLLQATQVPCLLVGLSGREAVSGCTLAGISGTDPPKCLGPGAERLWGSCLAGDLGSAEFSQMILYS